MTRPVSVWAQYLLPQRVLGTLVYRTARCRWAIVKRPLIRWFASRFRVDLSEAEDSNLDSYATFNDFFTRGLKRDARAIHGGERTVVSPVDGSLTEFGVARDGQLLQAKGMGYSPAELLGETDAEPTSNGFLTLYLAPHNYHRVHMPLAGALRRTRYIPGRRFSVNGATALGIPRLFCRNERVVCWFETEAGPLVVVLVGALNVASIATRWLGEIPSGELRTWDEPSVPPRRYARGDEIARFNLGSTVILLLPSAAIQWHPALQSGQSVRVGQALAQIRSADGVQ